MSKKVLTSMKDENSDLQKQIGCISGFFQLFDRHRFLTDQRSGSNSQKRPASGQGGTSNHIKEMNSSMQKATAKNVMVGRENQQFSTESSGTSITSSSCSSSMSFLEFKRTIQMEPPSISQTKTPPENSNFGAAMKQLDTPRHKALDFYDIVKDSMQREARALSVKTVAKKEKKGRILKHIDSPRPLQSPIFVNASWDSPRLSYDGRDIEDVFSSATKHKELPRLSLDSREGSIEGFNEGLKSSSPLKGPKKGYGNSSTMLKQLQEPETCKRPSSVVAKLMGLEAFPGCTQICDTPLGVSCCTTNRNETFVRARMSDEYKQYQSSVSPRTRKENTLLQSNRDASITNGTPYSRFSLEPTPWRKPDASQGSQLQASKGSESSTETSNSSKSVYGEIQKRMAYLEFKNSGKDLRALKQILEAMQRYKDSIDVAREQASNSPSDNKNNSSLSESLKVQSPRIRPKDPTCVTVEKSNSTQDSKLSNVSMKPPKINRETNNPASTEMPIHGKSKTAKAIGPTVRHYKDPFSQPLDSAGKSSEVRTSKLMQSSKVPQCINGKTATNFSNTAETRSPRLQKKFGLEKRSPPTSPSIDSSSNMRQHNRQSLELTSPRTTPRKKFSILEESNGSSSGISCQRRDFKGEIDVISRDIDSKRSMDSHSDEEAIHVDHSEKSNSTSINLNGQNQNNAAKELSKESLMAETIVTAEHPSPVSVLDAAFYIEEPPSPVKKKSDISKDLDEALNAYDNSDENSEDPPLSSNTPKAEVSNGTSSIDLKAQNLVQILQQNDYNNEELTNFSDIKDPDHKYISEILLASRLLSSLSSSQACHSPGHPINPKFFLALEQIRTSKMHFNSEYSSKKIAKINNPEQMRRKLIFDVVNDILVQKLILESSSTLWCLPNQPAGRKLKGQKLLDELCSEIDQLQHKDRNVILANEDEYLTSLLWEDLMHQPTICKDSYREIPNIVLGIERLIFKDLITEVVRGEVANHCGRYCRQMLFP